MKFFLLVVLSLLCFSSVIAQKKSRKDFFGGPKDYRSLSNNGLQLSFGPTYTFSKSSELQVNDRIKYNFDPAGRLGILAEIGTANFSLKKPLFKIGKIIEYTDWGIGGVIYGGKEITNLINETEGTKTYISDGQFYNIHATGRITFHNMWYIPKTTVFLDNGLGLNVDYRAVSMSSYTKTLKELTDLGIKQKFSNSLDIIFHYNFGIGYKVKRGSYFIPSIQLPILGAHKWYLGSTKTNWFSSEYYPVIFRLKYIYLFEKKSGAGCENFGSEEDRKRNEEYMQNK